MKRIRAFSVFLLFSLLGIQLIFAQQTININNESIQSRSAQTVLQTHWLGESVQTRGFDFNPQLKSLTRENEGDILLLDLFSDKQYRALVKRVTHSYNGITGITAKIENSDFGYCYISVSEEGILINMELPEKNEYYIATGQTGNGLLSEYKMSDLNKNKLECRSLSPFSTNGLPIGTPISIDAQPQAPVETPIKQSNTINSDENALAVINVLIVYTAAAKRYIETTLKSSIDLAIDAAMQKANEASINSQLNIDFNLVHSYLTDYQEVNSNADLDNLTNPDDGKLDEVHALRRQYNADLVMLIPDVEFTGGLGWRIGDSKGSAAHGFALSRVQQFSWTYTVVHEMAHNMGCGHHNDQKTQPGPGIWPYSGGWKGTINGENKCTIMTYGDAFYWSDGSSYEEIPYFSSPNITYPGSNVTIGNAQTADNARTIRQTKHAIASYKEIIDYTILTDLQVNGSTVSGFSSDKTNYTLTIESENITIKGTTTNSATVQGNITNAPLNYGENIFRLKVVSGTYTKNYTLIINRTVPPCGSYQSSPSFKGDVSAPSGDDALNLQMGPEAPVTEDNPLTISMTSNPSPMYIKESQNSTNAYTFFDGADLDVYLGTAKVKVTEDGDYTFTANFQLVLTLFNSEIPSHSSFINSSAYWTGGYGYSYNNRVIASLKANTTYYIRGILSSAPTNLLNITISGPGACYSELEIPTGMGYTYIAVDQSDNKIKKQTATADFRTLQAGTYTIYGIPYSHGSDPTTFIGKTINEIQDSDCVIPSSTSINMTVTGAASVYAVNVGQFTGGSISASSPTSPDGKTVSADETVTLTISVDTGYMLENIKVYKTSEPTETVTLNGSGNTRTFTMPAYDVTVEATFKKTQEQVDKETVEEAMANIVAGTYHIDQGGGNTEVEIRAWIGSIIYFMLNNSQNTPSRSAGKVTLEEVTITAFTPATAGTEAIPAGTNGSFRFAATLTLGTITLISEQISGVITATPFVAEKSIRVSLESELTIRILNTGNAATGDLTLTLSGENADAFILPSPTVNSLATGAETDVVLSIADNLPPDTYRAILTVSGEELASASADFSYTVIDTGINDPQKETFKAWVHNELLYVSGLTVGKLWSVYNTSDALIYQNIAENSEESVKLPARGIYIIVCGNNSIKVKY